MCVLIRKEICVDVLNCSIKFILLATNYVTVRQFILRSNEELIQTLVE